MSDPVDRRALLGAAAAGLVAAAGQSSAADDFTAASLPLGFSLYGMRSLPLDEAVAACGEIGYQSVELPVMSQWPADSRSFGARQREAFRQTLAGHQLRLGALMENLPIFGDEAAHRDRLRRIRQAGEVAHDICDQPRPVMETILGGKPAQWESVRKEMARRLERWAEAAEKARLVIAIKAHVGGAMHLPEHPAALVRQLDSPWIRAAYDFSHFRLRNVDMERSVRTLAPLSVFAHVKDAAGSASKVRFLLPGQGDTDYVKLLRLLVEQGYRGDICVEVSGQIHGKPGYDPVAAARDSFGPLDRARRGAEQ